MVLHCSQAPIARLFQPLCYSKAKGACYDHVRHIWPSISTVPADCYQSCVYCFTIVVMTVLGHSIHFWFACYGHRCKKAEGRNIHLNGLVTKKLKKSVMVVFLTPTNILQQCEQADEFCGESNTEVCYSGLPERCLALALVQGPLSLLSPWSASRTGCPARLSLWAC